MPEVFHRFKTRGRIFAPECKEPGADQSFEKEANINVIMARYQRTGLISNVNRKTPFWGDVSMAPQDLMEAQEIISQSMKAFTDLPARLRAMFNNSPIELMRWLEDPANGEEARRWGLLPAEPAESPKLEKKQTEGEIVKDFTHQSAQ